MKKKFKQYNVDDPIYRANLTLFIGDTEEIKKHLFDVCKISDIEIGEVHDGKFCPIKNYKIIILPKFDLLTVIHEVIHYAFAVMKERGIPIRYENDETITYYVEMTLRNILKVFKIKC